MGESIMGETYHGINFLIQVLDNSSYWVQYIVNLTIKTELSHKLFLLQLTLLQLQFISFQKTSVLKIFQYSAESGLQLYSLC